VKVKRVQHVSIPVPPGSGERARAFYTGILGMPEKPVPKELDSSLLTWFEAGDGEDEIHCFTDPDYENRSGGAHLCLEVDNVQAVRDRLAECGVTLEPETIPIHNRPRFFVRDPFGNLIEIAQIDGPYNEES
jgi:catechol 2,3-dioxygenase-like lactoylglutathione lyase family enzyme